MLTALEVGLILLIAATPGVLVVLALSRTRHYHREKCVTLQRQALYWTALALTSVSTITYLGYFVWRLCQIYGVSIPFEVSLWLQRLIYATGVLSVVALASLVVGRGPYRALVALAVLWETAFLWSRAPQMIHWA